MKLGVTLPQFTGDPEVLLAAARRAIDAGLDSIWLFEHLWPLSGGKERPILECWSTLAWLAERTDGVVVGTLVTRSSLRHPLVLAHMAATVAAIAPGRLVVGVGSGDELTRRENEAFGIPYWAGRARHRQLLETAAVVRERLDGRAPVWLGGRSAAIRAAAGRVADAWNAWMATPEEFAREAATVAAEPTWGGLAVLGDDDDTARRKAGRRDPARYLIGGPEFLAAHLGAIAVAGATHAVVTFPDAGAVGPYELLGAAVRPRLP